MERSVGHLLQGTRCAFLHALTLNERDGILQILEVVVEFGGFPFKLHTIDRVLVASALPFYRDLRPAGHAGTIRRSFSSLHVHRPSSMDNEL